jgi:Ca2+-binding RTX toxin-like protein
MYGGTGDDVMLGGTPATANIAHHPRDHSLPSDGNDTMLGGDGFDQVDGGNGDNLLDAGDDGIRETVLGGTGNDIGYSHQVSPFGYHRSDAMALDGGFNHDLHRGGLIEVQPPAEVCGFTVFVIPANAFIGQKRLHNGVIVDHPKPKARPIRDRIKLRFHKPAAPAARVLPSSGNGVPTGPQRAFRMK